MDHSKRRRDQERPHVGLECLWHDVTQSSSSNFFKGKDGEVEGLWRVRVSLYSFGQFVRV